MTPSILGLIFQLATSYHLDPLLVQAVIKTESNWNTKAIGTSGEVGLMQVLVDIKDRERIKVPKNNIKEGIKRLAEAKKYCAHKEDFEFVICYNKGITGGNKIRFPKKDSYYIKIKNAYKKVKDENKTSSL